MAGHVKDSDFAAIALGRGLRPDSRNRAQSEEVSMHCGSMIAGRPTRGTPIAFGEGTKGIFDTFMAKIGGYHPW